MSKRCFLVAEVFGLMVVAPASSVATKESKSGSDDVEASDSLVLLAFGVAVGELSMESPEVHHNRPATRTIFKPRPYPFIP